MFGKKYFIDQISDEDDSYGDDDPFFSPIVVASRNGNLEIVKKLLNEGVDPSEPDNDAIIAASEHGNLEVVKELLKDERVDPSKPDNFPIRMAARFGHVDVVKELLKDERVDPSESDNESIRLASQGGHLDVVKVLLKDPKVNPSANDNEAIRLADYDEHLETVEELSKDKRVDWRKIDDKTRRHILMKEREKLRKKIETSYFYLEKASPKINIEGKRKSAIPESIIKRTAYLAQYQELCEVLKIGEIPPVKLAALASLLNISYNSNISWKNLCGKVKQALLLLL